MIGEVALLELGVVIITLAIIADITDRFNESDIPLFIIIGIILGPYVLGRHSDFYIGNTPSAYMFIKLGGEFGVMFLLFFMGLSFNIQKLLKHRDRISLIGTIDLLNFAPGILIGYFFFQDIMVAFLMGGIVYISSSALISKTLLDLGWESTPEAEQMLEGLVFEDLFIVVFLTISSTLLLGGDVAIHNIAVNIGLAMLFIISLVLFLYYKPEFFDKFLDTSSDEIFVLRAIGLIALISGIAIVLGISEAIAAFFVGVAFGATEHMAKLQRLLYPFRYLFGGIFFFYIGMKTNPLIFWGISTILLITVASTTIYKFFTAYYGAKFFKLDDITSTRVGVGMITRGEFSLIIAALASEAVGPYAIPVITETIPAFAVSYVLVMSVLGSILLRRVK